MPTTKRKPNTVRPSAKIIHFAEMLATYQKTLARLDGIVKSVATRRDRSAVIHSLQSIRGYRRNTLRAANALLAAFQSVEELITEME